MNCIILCFNMPFKHVICFCRGLIMDKNIHYNYAQLRRDIQDEYLAAMLVGTSEDTPDLMDIQMAANDTLPELAERLGFDLSDYVISDDDFKRQSELLRGSQYH